MEGKFTLEIPKTDEAFLDIAFIGYITEEVTVKGEEELTITLEEDILALEEVVVVGYGAQRKQESAGSVSRIDLDDEYTPAPSIIPPKPICGIKEYKIYIKENIRYNELPEFDKNLTVKLKFKIDISGNILNIEIVKSEGEKFDNEAVRLLKEGPTWLPATENGSPIPKNVTLKVKFSPDNK